jgi:hypothetical protein
MSGISWTVLAGLLRALSVFAPLGGKQGAALQSTLVLAATLLERGEAGRHELEKLCADIDAMVAQGREPTPSEWAALLARSDAAHEAIQQAANEVPPGDSEGGSAD